MNVCVFCHKEISTNTDYICDDCKKLIVVGANKEFAHEKEFKDNHETILMVAKFGIIYATMVSIFSFFELYEYGSIGYVEALIVAILTWGVYNKSRISAIILLIFFVLSKIIAFSYGDRPGLVILLVYVLFFILFSEGIHGTQRYHDIEKKFLKKHKGRR